MVDFDALDALARQLMASRKAHLLRERGFIYYHGQRVSRAVLALRARVTQDASHDAALRVAGMFHDVGKGMEPHNEYGAVIARKALAPHLPGALLDEVCTLIDAHTRRERQDLWANLLQDADTIDHFGTVDVGMAFQYGAYNEEGMREALAWFESPDGLAATVAEVRPLLHFDPARAVFDERVAFSRAFAVRMAAELAGDYV